MTEYTATYSPDDNKLRLYSVARLDADTYARVKAAGFKWAPQQKLFVAPMWTPERADLLIDLCDEIGDEDTSLIDRAEERSERFGEYSEHRAKDADRAEAGVRQIADGIPLGQPILVGHHSERRARKDAERIENGMRKAVKMWETSQYWTRRAAGAIRHAKYKELPRVRANRIKTLEADRRRHERAIAESVKWLGAWGKINAPRKGELLRPGVYEMDPAPVDEALRLKRALVIANYSGVRLPHNDPRGWSVWDALDKTKLTPRDALLICCKHYGRVIRYSKRWTAHLDNRLAYERAMLDEQGGTALLAPKPRSLKASLPLCNYRAADGLQIENIYHKGQFSHYAQVEMTQAEYAAINQDYKGTRVVENSHRVRTCMERHSLVCVFLTDAKAHEKPGAKEPPQRAIPEPRRVVARAPDPVAERIGDLKTAIKAGVQVVAAPQLFPTPADVARQMVQLAGVQAGECVLEPSAGTGAIVKAVLEAVDTEVLAYEINGALCAALSRTFQSYKLQVRQRDFLEVTDFQGSYPKILMNPPFSNGADIKHIQHARSFLAPGGVLVAVCANGPRQHEHLKPEADAWIDLPAGTFADQGTNVNTAIVVFTAPR